MNLEQIILNKTGWKEKQVGYWGTVINNVMDDKNKPVADIVSRRSEKEISVDWFIPDQEGQKISLVYSLDPAGLNLDKTDPEIRNQEDIDAFLNTIEKTIEGNKSQFFPSKKIEAIAVKNKNTI